MPLVGQVRAYQHAIDHYKASSDFQINFDMDEYPFAPDDRDPVSPPHVPRA